MRFPERRRFGRITLNPPLRGDIDGVPALVMNVSVIGARLHHEGRVPRADAHLLRFEWNEHRLQFQCEIVRSAVFKLARAAGEQSVYESGIRLLDVYENSDAILRDLISDHVMHAINEQLANARGIPPLATYAYQTGKADRYRRCEFVDGGWRKSDTRDPQQPPSGFTIAADVDPSQIEMLCKTWQACDAEGRRLTQLLAQLSISKTEGTPTRRYEP